MKELKAEFSSDGTKVILTCPNPNEGMEKYNEMKESKDEDDRGLAKNFSPKKRYVIPHIRFKDEKGKDIDHEAGAKLALLTSNQYQDVIDTYLDEEYGDFTDEKDGYDIKYVRTGTGQFDTKYTLRPCKCTKLPKKFRGKLYNPEEMLRKVVPTYSETEDQISSYLGIDKEGKKKSKKKKSKKGKKKNKKK